MPRVLVVDDDPQIRIILRTALADAGFRVDEAGTGLAALRAMESVDFDLVILDVFMPELGGIDLLQTLPPRLRRIPVFVMTGGADRPTREPLDRAQRLGAVRTFSKPFHLAEVVAAAREATAGG